MDEFDQVIKRYHAAQGEFVKGNYESNFKLFLPTRRPESRVVRVRGGASGNQNNSLKVIEPATEKVMTELAEATVEEAVARAKAAYPAWAPPG